jgi:hypothetical protein
MLGMEVGETVKLWKVERQEIVLRMQQKKEFSSFIAGV